MIRPFKIPSAIIKPIIHVKVGWLEKKKDGMFKFWRERWCILDIEAFLRYYDSQNAIEAKRKGKGDDACCFSVINDIKRKGREFTVVTETKTWHFRAKTPKIAVEWIDAFNEVSNPKRKESEP